MVERIDPVSGRPEWATLVDFLDWYRATLELKSAGLTDEQAATASCPPSILTITGLVRHMAEVERNWFRRKLAGELPAAGAGPIYYSDEHPDGDLEVDSSTSLADSLAVWRAEIARADAVLAGYGSLDQLGPVATTTGEYVSARWVLVHMIEEYARHCGHADLLRERIDGAVGD